MRSTAAALLVLAATFALAQSPANAGLPRGTLIEGVMVNTVDSRHAKPGDKAEASVSYAVKVEGHQVLPKGTRLLGHVTSASARAKGATDSTLGLVFDRAVLKDGREIPLDVTLQGANPQTDMLRYRTGFEVGYLPDNAPYDAVTIDDEAVHSTGKTVRMSRSSRLALLVGTPAEVCADQPRLVPQLTGFPVPIDLLQGDFEAPALVVEEHRIVGCAESKFAWQDVSAYMPELKLAADTRIPVRLMGDLDSSFIADDKGGHYRSCLAWQLLHYATGRVLPLGQTFGVEVLEDVAIPGQPPLRRGTHLAGYVERASARTNHDQDSTLLLRFGWTSVVNKPEGVFRARVVSAIHLPPEITLRDSVFTSSGDRVKLPGNTVFILVPGPGVSAADHHEGASSKR